MTTDSHRGSGAIANFAVLRRLAPFKATDNDDRPARRRGAVTLTVASCYVRRRARDRDDVAVAVAMD